MNSDLIAAGLYDRSVLIVYLYLVMLSIDDWDLENAECGVCKPESASPP